MSLITLHFCLWSCLNFNYSSTENNKTFRRNKYIFILFCFYTLWYTHDKTPMQFVDGRGKSTSPSLESPVLHNFQLLQPFSLIFRIQKQRILLSKCGISIQYSVISHNAVMGKYTLSKAVQEIWTDSITCRSQKQLSKYPFIHKKT